MLASRPALIIVGLLSAVSASSSLSSSSSSAAAPTAAPTPPCPAPAGVVPVIKESLCFTQVAKVDPSGVSIRQYGFPTNATFVSGIGAGTFINGVQGGIASVLNYFSGANVDQRNILAARTVPIAVLPPGKRGTYWSVNMQVSPSQFPDDFRIPRPNPGITLSRVDENIGLMAVFAFNTTGFPYIEDVQEACGSIQDSTLPSGYAINTTHPWSPTYVFYNGERDANYTNECWMAVYAVKA